MVRPALSVLLILCACQPGAPKPDPDEDKPPVSSIKDDERLELFPSVARRDGSGAWVVPIHGWIYEPEADSVWRAKLVGEMAEAFELEPLTTENVIFRARARRFFVDNESGKTLRVRIAGAVHDVGTSGADGHVEGDVRLATDAVDRACGGDAERDRLLTYQVRAKDGRTFDGAVQCLAARGRSVVSDIDDTIKVSEVRDKKRMLRRTFLEPFEMVDGMAAAYQRWRDAGASFHYVSASPWQLHADLAYAIDQGGFPQGSYHLKKFRLKDETFFNLFMSPEAYKLASIEPLLAATPTRTFVLVGDSGEKDPEAYGELARRHPGQVEKIWIRDVSDEPREADRYAKAFAGVPPERWAIFRDPKALE